MPNCAWAGSPACFLFSLTLDLKLPYHGRRVPEAEGVSADEVRTPISMEPMAFFAQPDALFIGNGDLTINADLSAGSTELENCYGIGLIPNTPETFCLLTGSPFFNIDDVELWAITT